jgi:o-succinylbenzoate---CoA ligase
MGTIYLRQQAFSFEDIRIKGADLLTEEEEIHHATFALAQHWLLGQQEFVFHTSGSTGAPKEIWLQRAQLEASAKGTIEALKLTSNEHILLCMNTQFIGGAMLLIRGLILNANITLQAPNGNPLELIAENHPYTFASFAPLQLFPLLQNLFHEKEKLLRFKHVLVGGAAIHSELEKLLSTSPNTIYQTYGMTETVSHIALKQIGKKTFFTLLPGVNIRTDERECIAIQSPSTQFNWIQTNDVVKLIDDHSFEILGRADEVINSGGVKIWPEKIEQMIREILQNRLTNIIVLGLPDIKLGDKIIAVIESNNELPFLQIMLEKELPHFLAKYEIPKQFYVLPQFVYTATNKINKVETLKMIALQ